ncbi:hypothetical protein [Turicibacter sanguinis]|uniref:hypothetical protein n=1 Tax=Turicibacter sanguinis TaxID=154288 RepID=UPI0021D4DD00|nr:hypothetical protein [Turicibacter sanguinis]MCU7190044.1 hypothetical protein [Turicibacter sanguinis]
MRLQQMLFAAFASSVLLIGCSKPVDASAYDQTTIVDHDHDMKSDISILVETEMMISTLNNDSNFSFQTLYHKSNDASLSLLNEMKSLDNLLENHLGSDRFKICSLNGNYYLSCEKAIQLFHKEEEIMINGEYIKLNRYP